MSLVLRTSVPASRLEALQSRHAALEEEIREEQRHYYSSDHVKELKRKKLFLKEEIEDIRQAS